MYKLTIVCSDALLYDAALQEVNCWNIKNSSHPTVEVSYMTPREWLRLWRDGLLFSPTLLLDGLPWRLKLFRTLMEYEKLDYGTKIGYADEFSAVISNPDKILKLSKCDELHNLLVRYTGKNLKHICPSLPSSLLCLSFFSMLMSLENAPIISVAEAILLAYLLWERKQVKLLQDLYGTILQVRTYLSLLPEISKPADIR